MPELLTLSEADPVHETRWLLDPILPFWRTGSAPWRCRGWQNDGTLQHGGHAGKGEASEDYLRQQPGAEGGVETKQPLGKPRGVSKLARLLSGRCGTSLECHHLVGHSRHSVHSKERQHQRWTNAWSG